MYIKYKMLNNAFICLAFIFFLTACSDEIAGTDGNNLESEILNGIQQGDSNTQETALLNQNEQHSSDIREIDLEAFHGSWEANLGSPFNHSIIINYSADEQPHSVTVSIVTPMIGYYFLEVGQEIEDDTLKLWWNDEANRLILELHFNDENSLIGTISQYGQSLTTEFLKISDIPERGEFRIQNNFTTLLLESSDLNRPDSIPVQFEYLMDDPRLEELREKYNLEEVAGDGDTLSKVLNLLHWLGDHTHHYGYFRNHIQPNSLALLEYAFDREQDFGLNCMALSTVLTEVYLSLGIQARNLWLMPKDPNDMDNHVITMAYIPEMEKWVMVDPSFNSYLMDLDGNVLSPLEIRQKLANEEDMMVNPESKIGYLEFINYLAKNMYYFYSMQKTTFGFLDRNSFVENEVQNTIYLTPVDFDLNEWGVQNSLFRGNGQSVDFVRERINTFATPESFWGR